MTSEVPSAQTATTETTETRVPGMRQRFAGLGLKKAVRQAGTTLSKREAQVIAKQSNKSVAEVMSGAVDQGVALGSNLVNKFNRGKLGPSFSNSQYLLGGMFRPPATTGVAKALQNLQPLQGVSMPTGSVYAGSTAITREGQTTFNPVVLPKAVLKGAMMNISGDLGYSAPTQSGTSGEAAATAASTTPSAPAQAKRTTAKQKAKKMIQKRQAKRSQK